MSNGFLKMNEVHFFDVDYSDFERKVNEFFPALTGDGKYDFGFSYQADQELGDDVAKTFTVRATEPDEWAMGSIEGLKAGRLSTFITSDILNYWCWMGFIPEGDYIMETH